MTTINAMTAQMDLNQPLPADLKAAAKTSGTEMTQEQFDEQVATTFGLLMFSIHNHNKMIQDEVAKL